MERNEILQDINESEYIIKQTLRLEGKHTANTRKLAKRVQLLKQSLIELNKD
jgi:hypothetical protein